MLKNEIPAALAKHGPQSNEGLRQVCPGASRSGVHRVLQEMKDARAIHIVGYVRSNDRVGGAHVPIYALGNLPDVAKPVTRKEAQAARKLNPVVKPEKVKPAAKDNGRPTILRIAIKPQAQPALVRARPQPAGMWSGLMA
jgi:hypothetical protein